MNAPKLTDSDIPAHGREVHLKGFGFVQVFRTVAANGDVGHEKIEHWATIDLKMEDGTRQELACQVFAIENYHRQLTPNKALSSAVASSGRSCEKRRRRSATFCCLFGPSCAWRHIG